VFKCVPLFGLFSAIFKLWQVVDIFSAIFKLRQRTSEQSKEEDNQFNL
jgi:hypothetical protein